MTGDLNWKKFGLKDRSEFYKVIDLYFGEDFGDLCHAYEANDRIEFALLYAYLQENWKEMHKDNKPVEVEPNVD